MLLCAEWPPSASFILPGAGLGSSPERGLCTAAEDQGPPHSSTGLLPWEWKSVQHLDTGGALPSSPHWALQPTPHRACVRCGSRSAPEQQPPLHAAHAPAHTSPVAGMGSGPPCHIHPGAPRHLEWHPPFMQRPFPTICAMARLPPPHWRPSSGNKGHNTRAL